MKLDGWCKRTRVHSTFIFWWKLTRFNMYKTVCPQSLWSEVCTFPGAYKFSAVLQHPGIIPQHLAYPASLSLSYTVTQPQLPSVCSLHNKLISHFTPLPLLFSSVHHSFCYSLDKSGPNPLLPFDHFVPNVTSVHSHFISHDVCCKLSIYSHPSSKWCEY